MHITWNSGFEISASICRDEVTISANREGMLSLAHIFASLADGQPGDHLHLDEHNSLEERSASLVIERIP